MTEESRRKMSLAKLGKKIPPAQRVKMIAGVRKFFASSAGKQFGKEQSERNRRWWANRPLAERKAHIEKLTQPLLSLTKEQRAEKLKPNRLRALAAANARWKKMDKIERNRFMRPVIEKGRIAAKKRWALMPPKEREETFKRIHAKAKITSRNNWEKMSEEQRGERIKGLIMSGSKRLKSAAETKMKSALRKLGVRYRSQIRFACFVADIYIPSHNAVIECDGRAHRYSVPQRATDVRKDAYLKSVGVKFVRVTNIDIEKDVIAAAKVALKKLKISFVSL